MNAFVVEQLLSGTSHYSARFTTLTADWTKIESSPPPPPKITFACLSVANIYYGPFGELQERLPSALQITTGSVIATHYSKYGELLEGPEDQLILDNNDIAEDVGNAEKPENEEDKKTSKDNNRAVDGEDQKDSKVGKASDGENQEVSKADDGGD